MELTVAPAENRTPIRVTPHAPVAFVFVHRISLVFVEVEQEALSTLVVLLYGMNQNLELR